MSDEAVRKEFEAVSDKFAADFVDVFGGFPKDQAISLLVRRQLEIRSAAIQECAAIVRARANRTVTRGSLNAAAEEILALKER